MKIMKPNHTKDEKFILTLYAEAEKRGDLEASFDRYEIGKLSGLQERGVDATCKLLIQANFIKKSGESEIYLTPHGQQLILRLRDE